MFKKNSLLICLTLIINIAFAKVEFPSVISDGMVLQQKTDVNIWGTASKSSNISVTTSWNNKSYTVTADNNGYWKAEIKTPTAGGPYTITCDDGEKTILNDILIGEVWVCSGQSNMQITLAGFKNQPVLKSDSIVANSTNENLRVFTVDRELSSTPQPNCKGDWKKSNPENAIDFSAVAFQYGQMLQEKLKVPVGLIVTSWGGTPIRSWMGKGVNPFIEEEPDDKKVNQNSATVLYNAMIAPLTSYTIKGFIWYQGESDRTAPEHYDEKMEAMVKEWRNEWRQGTLPFYFVQIAPWLYSSDKKKDYAPYLREAQLKASKTIPNSVMVVTTDVGAKNTIHPPDKTTVANRLLKCALGNAYDKDVDFHGPEYKSMKVKGDKILLKFKYDDGLFIKDKPSENFEIAGADKIFHKAEVEINATGLMVSSNEVPDPVAVRYGFKNYLIGGFYNRADLPASPFRTDDWEY